MTALAPTLQAFFTERLAGQRGASPNTVAAYRDTFRLLLTFAAQRTGNPPAFLDHLERDRHNSVRTRNNRLAAVHSLFGYAALRHPEHAASIQRVLAIGPGTVPASVDTGIGGSDLRENSKWVRHAPDLPRNTNNKQ
jgi:integrase/recombinase XerD